MRLLTFFVILLIWNSSGFAQSDEVPSEAIPGANEELSSSESSADVSTEQVRSSQTQASEAQKRLSEKIKNPKVLDFEAELIEGERKTPTLFLQIGLEKPTMDAVLYQRKDFNDFHETTKDRRPSYQVPRKKK